MVTLMKAKSVGSTTNPSGGAFGSAGSVLKIKVSRYRLRSMCPLEDTTGDGDNGLALEEAMAHDAITLIGWVVGAAAIGLANLGNSQGAIVLLLDSGRNFSGNIKIANAEVNWRRTGGAIPIALSGRFEDRLTEGTTA